MAIVYRHIRKDKNEVFYIGIGSSKYRAFNFKKRNEYWKRVFNITEIEVEILFEDISYEDACKKEIEFIKLYGRKDLGLGTLVNMTDGGENNTGKIFTEEHKRKIGDAQRGEKNHMYNKTGEKNHFFGKKHNEETIKKMSGANNYFYGKGHLQTGEKNHMYGKTGEMNHFFGKTHTEETKEKIRESNKKRKGIKQKVLKCPHCELEGGSACMKRYHFDKCKKKLNQIE